MLLRERQLLQRGTDSGSNMQSYNTIIEHSTDNYGTSVNPSPSRHRKSGTIQQKINEIIEICAGEISDPSNKSPESYKDIIEAERQVLGYL